MNLRDALLNSIACLPGTRDFHIHVLSSSPRKHSGLFPYATPRPKVYLQDILILLSEQSSSASPRVLVSAVEANVYTIPATSCAILYISKVDSTAQGGAPAPTATLVKSLIAFYADPETRPVSSHTLWVQLFARAQGQYLFPNSADFEGKHPLSDVKLCAWWRKVFTEVAEGLEKGKDEKGKGKVRVKSGLYYVLPGYNELEAIQSLKLPLNPSSLSATSTTSTSPKWTYGHPYSQTEIPLPCPPHTKGQAHTSLGHYVPSFDDDPKSRFMDEIALTTDSNGIKSPKKKKPKTTLRKPESKANGQSRPHREDDARDETTTEKKDKEDDEEGDPKAQGELDKVSPDEFWERMSFRQECIAGAVTGFFALGITSTDSSPREVTVSAPSPLAPQPGQVAPRLVRRVVASLMNGHEFSTTERSIRATQVLEDAIKGLCENIGSVPAVTKPTLASTAHLLFLGGGLEPSVPEAEVDGDGDDGRREEDDDDKDENDDGDASASVLPLLEIPRTPPRRSAHLPDISPNPFPEPVTSLETYHSHIYGTVSVSNPPLPPKGSAAAGAPAQGKPVTVLAVRKKKRKTES
ncbi:hypothetical protein EUX98_g5367 [Antrodiella citrinella]|uniref:histone acetyltransferase n=1 Tax=Antrodiella citrinella TaxID=2447956 RepID=A0A4S4MRK9_9APHY|nr:hypothetical protein EUX98_g5367 [Antrodiella citrinella]